jgi:ribosome-associated protein
VEPIPHNFGLSIVNESLEERMPADQDVILLTTGEVIPVAALEFATSRSGGPGGQNVNKVETKVEVRFTVAGSLWISDETQRKILEKLASRIDNSGSIRVASSVERTQRGNRIAAVARLERILNQALIPEKPRVPTKPSRAAKQRRVDVKRRNAEKKAGRKWRPED